MFENALIGWLIVSLITGLVCAFFAKEKGRNVTAWFVGGFIGSFLACFIIVLISNKIQAKKNNR